MKKSKSGTRQKSNTNLVKKKHIFLHVYFFFQWYILDDVSPLSIQLATEKKNQRYLIKLLMYNIITRKAFISITLVSIVIMIT